MNSSETWICSELYTVRIAPWGCSLQYKLRVWRKTPLLLGTWSKTHELLNVLTNTSKVLGQGPCIDYWRYKIHRLPLLYKISRAITPRLIVARKTQAVRPNYNEWRTRAISLILCHCNMWFISTENLAIVARPYSRQYSKSEFVSTIAHKYTTHKIATTMRRKGARNTQTILEVKNIVLTPSASKCRS